MGRRLQNREKVNQINSPEFSGTTAGTHSSTQACLAFPFAWTRSAQCTQHGDPRDISAEPLATIEPLTVSGAICRRAVRATAA